MLLEWVHFLALFLLDFSTGLEWIKKIISALARGRMAEIIF